MEDYWGMGYEEMEDILFEMFGVDNDAELEYALDCWNND